MRYTRDKVIDHTIQEFELLDNADQINEYNQFFYEWSAPLQIMDDIMDLEEDLKNGHYSYPTLGFENEISGLPPGELAARILSNTEHLQRLVLICQELIDSLRN